MRAEVLVTGAGGFVGHHIAAACQEAGWSVTGVDRRFHRPFGPEVETIVCDAADPELLAVVRAGRFAAVVHQAALTDTLADDRARVEHENVAVPNRVADACATGGALFVYASSGSVYGKVRQRRPVTETDTEDRSVCSEPLNLYASSKLALDRSMQRHRDGLRWVGLRYTNVFGPGEEHKGAMASILSQIVKNAALGRCVGLFEDTLDAHRDYVPVAAVAETVVRLLEVPVRSGVFNLGSGVPVSFRTLLDWCRDFGGGADIEVRLVPNSISHQYQFWTCADTTALRALLSGPADLTLSDVRSAAHDLYRSCRPSRPPEEQDRTLEPGTFSFPGGR